MVRDRGERSGSRERQAGGGKTIGQLVANTLEGVRAMLPADLTRREPTVVMSADVVKTWD